MKLVREEDSSKSYLIEHFDDLWVLSKYIQKGDIICSKTQRKVALGGDNKKQVTKIMYVELEVKKTSLTSHSLDLLGNILNENEFTKVGAHHSLHYEIGETIEIKVDEIKKNQSKSNYLTKLFEDSLSSSKNKFVIILLDVDSMVVSKCSKFSIDVLYEGSRLGPKKYFSTTKQQSTIDEMFSILQELALQDFEIFIFAGPGKYKNELSNVFKKNNNKKQILIIDTQDSEVSTISQVMQKLEDSNIISDLTQGKVDSRVEDFLQQMQHDISKIAYSKSQVLDKISQGAVKEVIFTSEIFDEIQEESPEKIIQIEQLNTQINIIENSTQKGKIVEGLGGAIAFLRF